jgi:hypothetical protein
MAYDSRACPAARATMRTGCGGRRTRKEDSHGSVARWPPLVLALVAAAGAARADSGHGRCIVPAAGRGGPWSTDLYIMNPGSASPPVDHRRMAGARPGQPEPSCHVGFAAARRRDPGAHRRDLRGLRRRRGSYGAFRVVADQPVLANSRIFSFADGRDLRPGLRGRSGRPLATAAGETTDVVGLSQNSQFRHQRLRLRRAPRARNSSSR